MAETVKKSRIDNLKNNTETIDDDDDGNNHNDNNDNNKQEEPYYDNIEIIQTNHQHHQQQQQKINSSREFIEIEKEHYYEEPAVLINGNNKEKQNGHDFHDDDDDDSNDKTNDVDDSLKTSLYENIVINNQQQQQQQQQQHSDNDEIDKTDKKLDQYVDMTQNLQIVENYEIIDNNQIINDQDHNEEEELPEYEDIIDNNNIDKHINIITINNDDNDVDDNKQEPPKSIKDRMLLSTDAQPCLFFTQTITSPMLTPSEENIDFLKVFNQQQQQQQQTVVVVETNDIVEQSKIGEKSELMDNQSEEVVIYQNLQDLKENIYENVVDLKNQQQQQQQQIKCASDSAIVCNSGDPITTTTTTKPRIVEALKTQFTEHITTITINNNNNNNNNNDNDKNNIDIDDDDLLKRDEIDCSLKSVDIMKQINKFEGKVQDVDNNDDDDDDDSQMSETYVETTFETTTSSSLASPTEKSLKKKKTKKSRKEEKENISVTTNPNNYNNYNNSNNSNDNGEYCYNVNVKNLCRSFGDLTKLQDDKFANDTNAKNNRMREKFYTIGDVVGRTMSKSSFNKFDALQKKNVLHIRSSDSSKAQEKFNGQISQIDNSNCRACDKAVFQMEQIKAEKSIWHRNCFRCKECNKQLNVDSYQSHEGTLYCKPHFKALFAPKAVEDDEQPKSRKPELIIRENQPVELPPDVVRASDKPDLGLEELQSLNVKERFQVFEQQQNEMNEIDRQQQLKSPVNVKRSPSILSKLARFQAKGMDIGVTDDALNGIPIEESSTDDDDDEDRNHHDGDNNTDDGLDENGDDVDDVDLIRAKRVQKEKPFHFTGMTDVKNKWENVEQINSRDERREERKQEIQSIRNRLFMGKQGKMKEAYQQAVMESESCTNLKREQPIEVCDKTKSLKEKFEKGEIAMEKTQTQKDNEDVEVYESEISKKSRSLFLELDANASKPPQITPMPTPKLDVKRAREAYLAKTASSEDVVKSSIEQVDDVMPVRTADIQQRFKFFETYKEPEKERKQFRITPPREGQVKVPTPDREVYRDPEIVRAEEHIEDSIIAKEQHTATKMLSKFRQMEENLTKEPQPIGPKPLKCFTPPPEPVRDQQSTSEEDEDEDEDNDQDDDDDDEDQDGDYHLNKVPDDDLLEAQKAARAKQLRAKFERWEANEIKKEQANGINIAEELGDEQSIETTRTLRARFESMRSTTTTETNRPKVKVNRFVEIQNVFEICESCKSRVYPLEKVSIHERIYHKNCFKCMECNCILRMDSYSYNQGLLYCMPHFKRLFITKGNYDSAFGLGQQQQQQQEKDKSKATVA